MLPPHEGSGAAAPGGSGGAGGVRVGSRGRLRPRGGASCGRWSGHDEPILALDVDRAAAQIVTGAAETTVCVSSLSRARAVVAPPPPLLPKHKQQQRRHRHRGPLRGADSARPSSPPPTKTAPRTRRPSLRQPPRQRRRRCYALAKSHSITLDKAGVEALALRGDPALLPGTAVEYSRRPGGIGGSEFTNGPLPTVHWLS